MPRKQRFKPSRKPKPGPTSETIVEPTRSTTTTKSSDEPREAQPEDVEPRDRSHEG